MAEATNVDWLKLGREHLWLGRPIDAVLCLRRAVAAKPGDGNARFHLGEALWQLGLADGARDTWRDGTVAAPDHLALKLAYAEASLNTGAADEARKAAADALAASPDDPRARTFLLVAGAMQGAADADWGALAQAIAADPAIIAAPARSRLIAEALARTPGAPGHDAMLAALAGLGDRLPLDLAALLLEAEVAAGARDAARIDALLALAAARDPREAPDSLRRAARAAQACGRAGAADAFARRYAEAMVESFASPVPLLWPQRTAGDALRVAALVSPASPAAAVAALAALARDDLDVTVVAAVGTGELEAFVATLPLKPRLAMAAGPVPDAAAARALAQRDPDLVVDACGLECPVGPWLALKPGRERWSVAGQRPPLVERTIEASAAALEDALRGHAAGPSVRATAPELARRWNASLGAHRAGDAARARAGYDALLADAPGFAPALHFRGRLRWDAGDDEGAVADFEQALRAAPAYADARVDASRLALERQLVGVAARLAEEGLALQPGHAGLARALGHAQLKAGLGRPAAASFERALAADPLAAETHYNLGVALQLAGDVEGAARAYQRAVTLDPAQVEADFNLGVLFHKQGRRRPALEAFRRVVERDPSRDAAWKNAGEVLREAGRVDEWIANFRRFEKACPQSLLLAVQALEVCQSTGDFARLDRYLDGLRAERFRARDETTLIDALEELLYLLLFFDVEPSVVHRFARTYDASASRVYGAPRARTEPRKPGRLRVGYLSADLRDHVMGKMMWSAIRHHDRERFDVHVYSMSTVRDAWTERFASAATAFRELGALDDRAAVRLIEADDLDLLVDLQTHTKGARPGILALKPARVQVTHVASAGTLGLSAIDFKLTDAIADLPEAQEHQVEPLLAMAGCVYPWRAVRAEVVPAFDRAAAGLPADAFVLGAFVTPLKLSRRCLALWREVAERIPRALFLFSPARAEDRPLYLRLAAAGGIAADRVRFLPMPPDDAAKQARYRVVDAVLDPMPFGNVNGTIEPLAMGVPVVTLLGRRHGERAGASILTYLGVESTIAHSGREYVDLAVRLAEDPAFAREVRDAIARGLASSTLVDGPGYARRLEAAYVAAIAQKAPEALAAAGVDAPVAR